MQVTRGFLVLCLAIGLSESSPGPGQFRFSDILGPIRNMFGSRGQNPQGYTLKDLTGSETGKGHQNQGHQGQGQDDGYRPYFPASGDFDYPQGGPSQGFGKYPLGPPSSRYPSGAGPIGSPSNPSHSPPPNGMKAIGIPVYVKPGHEYGRGGPPGSSSGGYRRPTRQESGVGLFSGFGGPSSSSNDDSQGGGFEGFPSYFGNGGGHGGGPSSSYQGYQQERPSRPYFGGGGGGPSSRGPPSGGLFSSGSSRPYRVAPSPHYGGSPSSSSSQGPSYYSSQGQGQGPQYYDDFQGGPQGAYDSREPEIITLDDVQKPFGSGPGGPPSSNHLAGFTNFEGPSPPQGHRGGPHGHGPPRGYRGQPSSHRPSYPPHHQQQSDENGPVIYRSNPMRPSTRPFGGPFGSSSSDEDSGPFGPSPQESGKVIFRPIDESLNPSGQSEEVYYGKPMMMSSSNDQKTWRKKSGGKRFRKFYKGGGNISSMSGPQRAEILDLEESRRSNKLKLKPILLESPTVIGGPMTKSESQISANYEPQQAASGHGHNDFHSNGDRILYHVAGHQGPYSYRFGYDTGHGYNRQFRHEEKDGHGHVKGKYGFMDKNGKMNVVNYQGSQKNHN